MSKPCRWSVTRRTAIKRLRHELVHAAGERLIHPDCVITTFWTNPIEALKIWTEECEEDAKRDMSFVLDGLIKVPRSLRPMWTRVINTQRLLRKSNVL